MNSGVEMQTDIARQVWRRCKNARILTGLGTILFLCGLPLSASGQIFTCKDGTGRTLTSDHPMPECADRSVRELSITGLLRREIPAPLSSEQKRQLQLIEEKQRMAAQALEDQRHEDRALLARYRSEDDIATTRRYYLGLSQDMIKHDQAQIADAQWQLTAAETEAKSYKNKKIPVSLLWRFDDAHAALVDGKINLRKHQKEASGINVQFDDILVRYRHLNLTQSADSGRTARP